MPVILRQENYDLWLDPGFKNVQALAELLAPFDASRMKSFPVSTRINAVANHDPDCVVPWHRDLPAQSALFGQQSGLFLAGLLHHLDEYFSGLRRVDHFPHRRDLGSLHAILIFGRRWKPRPSTEVIFGLMRINVGKPIYEPDARILMFGVYLDEAAHHGNGGRKQAANTQR